MAKSRERAILQCYSYGDTNTVTPGKYKEGEGSNGVMTVIGRARRATRGAVRLVMTTIKTVATMY